MNGDILPLRVEGLGYIVAGVTLLNGVAFALERGPRTVILGPNGSGKSLLLRLCHGLLQPSSGSVRWNRDAGGETALRHAMVFQRPVMLRRSVAANVDYAISLHRLPRSLRRERVEEALRVGGLEALAERPARVLSGGEIQRLAIVRAWACRPSVLFLDEPTANLDPAASGAVERLVDRIHGDGTKIVMTTHDLGQARRLADEVFFMYRGRLIEHARAEDFFAGPATAEASAFLAGELLW
ncbi:MAG: ATP-binding cassette domain-containing protein [Rhodospirillaceae bacterium]